MEDAATVRRLAALLAIGLAACSPTLDWRDVRPPGSGLVMLFPCRPAQAERAVALAGTSVPMQLASCTAGAASFSLAVLDAGTPAQAPLLLAALQALAVSNVGGVAQLRPPASAVAVSSAGRQSDAAAAMPVARQIRIDGRLPDGRVVIEEALFFSRGTRVYQATVLSSTGVSAETTETFFTSIRSP